MKQYIMVDIKDFESMRNKFLAISTTASYGAIYAGAINQESCNYLLDDIIRIEKGFDKIYRSYISD